MLTAAHRVGGTGPNTTGGYYGTGDHWIAGTIGAPVSTYYTLYDENDTPYEWGDDSWTTTASAAPQKQSQSD